MYHKALEFRDLTTAELILQTSSPRKQKGLGAKVANFDQERWVEVREGIVERGNVLKFMQGTDIAGIGMDEERQPKKLRDLLMGTGERELVEASPFDRVWGIGYTAEQAMSVSRGLWGENLLGKALMRVRDRLREECMT